MIEKTSAFDIRKTILKNLESLYESYKNKEKLLNIKALLNSFKNNKIDSESSNSEENNNNSLTSNSPSISERNYNDEYNEEELEFFKTEKNNEEKITKEEELIVHKSNFISQNPISFYSKYCQSHVNFNYIFIILLSF